MDAIRNLIPEQYLLLISIGVIMGLTFLAGLVSASLFRRAIKRSEMEEGHSDLTNLKFLKRGVTVLIYLIGIGVSIYIIPELRGIAKGMFASAGLLAIAVGFAAQQALANIVSGVFIVIFKPYKIGDRILVRTDLNGVVEDINLRHTVIRNFENKRIIIPNSVISNEVLINSNYTDSKIIKWIDMSISYDSDLDLARVIMTEEVESHPNFIDGRTQLQIDEGDPLVPVRLISFGESS
ncbi:MAG: mechanosensitive ion channel family protein, partial [Balneola sp.]